MTPKDYAILFLAAAVVVLAYFHFKPAPIPTGVQIEAKPAKEVARVPTVPVPVKQVQAYPPAAKKKLDLPKTVQQDAGQHVVASTRTPADERPHTVTTVLDARSGEFHTYDRADPQPWLAVNTRSQVGVLYGYRNGEPAIRIEGHQELLQVKAVHLGAVASADATAGQLDTFVGVGVWARW
jgi:hypothetical protein